MSKKLMKTLVLSALVLALGMPLWAAETAEEAAPVTTTALPADEAGACSAATALPAELMGEAAENALFNPDGTPVCTFCNLSGFVNCESTDGTACSAAGVSKRCYINPPCACEWGRCRCNGTTWDCFW